MSDFGLTETGFKRKRLDLLLQELNDNMKAIFGDNFNVSPESPDGQVDGVISESNANLWEIAEYVYDAFNPSTASGVPLSNLVQLNGITRQPAVASRVSLTLTGVAGTVIQAGSITRTNDTGDIFITDTEAILDALGSAVVFATAENTGAIQANANTIQIIETPVTGWDTVNNPTAAIVGRDDETDPELRARRARSQAINAQAVLDAMFAAVSNIEGVTKATVLENDTDVIDANDLPPHSFEVIVVGGEDQEIGDTIWLKKSAGITTVGTTTVQVLDTQGIPHDINFQRPTTVDIFVEVDLTTFAGYPADGDDQVKQAIVDYANGDLVEGEGFGLSQDVIYTRLFTPINFVPGHEIDALRIGIAPSPTGTVNIPIAVTEISNFLVVNIIVNS